jgi:hypothetical protein
VATLPPINLSTDSRKNSLTAVTNWIRVGFEGNYIEHFAPSSYLWPRELARARHLQESSYAEMVDQPQTTWSASCGVSAGSSGIVSTS